MASTKAETTEEPTPGFKRPALEAAKLGEVKGRTFLITGAYSGIGVETVKALLAEGGKVIIGGRNEKLLEEFTAKMKADYEESLVDSALIDLGDLASVQSFAKYILDKKGYKDLVVICNAGVMNTPNGLTKSGFDMQMGVNVVGHFLLCKLLAGVTARQVWVSSLGHTMDKSPRINIDLIKQYQSNNFDGYDGWKAYQQSKLGDILVAKEFGKRYEKTMKAASLHPGGIFTNLSRHTGMWGMFVFLFSRVWELSRNATGHNGMKSVEAGASTTVTVATMPAADLVNGGYYEDCGLTKESESAKNDEDAAALFDFCDEVTKGFQ